MIRLAIVNASLSESSSSQLLGSRLSEATVDAIKGQEVEVTEISLRELAHDITNAMLTGFPAGALAKAIDTMLSADGVIAITPTYKASMSGLFKSFFDITDEGALIGKPILLGATGGSPRHSLMIDTAMRPMFSYLKSNVVTTGVFAATEDWGRGAVEDGTAPLDARIARAGRQFAAQLVFEREEKPARTPTGASDDDEEFGAGIDFESMIKQYT